MQSSGFFLVDKPEGPTSNRVLQNIKKNFSGVSAQQRPKFGHAGTLDSFASGLLVVLVGNLTRLTPWFMHQTKEYEAIFCFGQETDTLDPIGRVIATGKLPTLNALESVLPQFRGTISQTPPLYSSVHVGGRRSYELAKSGESPELSERQISIERLELRSFEDKRATFSIYCSSGTYVRSLARDIAQACGSRAFVQSLRRTRIGPFDVGAAYLPDDCVDKKLQPFTAEVASSIGLGAGILQKDFFVSFQHGAALPPRAVRQCNDENAPASVVALFAENGEFFGLVEKKEEKWTARIVTVAQTQDKYREFQPRELL